MADTGMVVGLIKALGGTPDPAVITEAVNDWLDDHPEATTTVEDGSITKAKLDSNLAGAIDDVGELKTAIDAVENAIDDLEAGSLSALGATAGQVPVADGEGTWAWGAGGGGDVTEETVSGTTPSITGAANTRYMCGEVASISITPPASGTIEVIFTSGTTPAVLTLPSTVKLPEWFDATALEASAIYDFIITDGVYGAVMTWAA